MLKGQQVELRALEPTDLELLYTWENNPAIWKVSNTIVPFSKFVLHQYLENQHLDIFTTKQLRLVIQTKLGVAIGLIDVFDFDPINARAGLGILITNEEYRGQGNARESVQLMVQYLFSHLSLHQVYVNIEASNEASLHLFKSAGFKLIGVKKDWNKRGNQFEDELIFQIIQP